MQNASRATVLHRITSSLIVALFVVGALHRIGAQWQWGHDGYNGAAFSQAARNSLRFGLIEQAQYWTDVVPPPADMAYTHHPLLLHAHLVCAYGAFGVHEWLGRAISAAYSIGALILLMLLARRLAGRDVALLAGALWVLTPMNVVFANMINHEPGSIFWNLVLVSAWLAWWRTRRRRHGALVLVAVTVAAQFDWPAYYIAFFLAVHGFVRGLRERPSGRRWSPGWTFVAVFSAVVLVNFFGFFGWIWWVRGSLDDMRSSFAVRSGHIPGGFALAAQHIWNLTGPVLLTLGGGYVVWSLVRVFRRRATHLDLVACVFLGAQAIHSMAFPQAGAIHSYWTWHANPGLALGGASLLVSGAGFIRARVASRLGRYTSSGRARRVATVLAAAALAAALGAQAHFAVRATRWGFETGRAAYPPQPYDDQWLEVQWARALAAEWPREEVTWIVHSSAQRRIEVEFYLDAPIVYRETLSFSSPEVAPGASRRCVLLVDASRLTPAQRLSLIRLASRHPTTIWAGRLVAVDGSRAEPELRAFSPQAESPPWWWAWLVDPRHPPVSWVALANPRLELDALLP